MSGDVASFDRQAFKESLAADLGVDASSVLLTLRPGSVVVIAAIPDTSWAGGGIPDFEAAEIKRMGDAAASTAGADVLEQVLNLLSALVPTSRWVSSHVLSSSQHKGGKEERNSAGEEKAEEATVLRRHHHQNDGPSSSVRGEGVESSDIERRRVNASVAWSSMR